MLSIVDQIAIYAFAALALYAAWTDIRSYTIPNRTVMAIALLWLAHATALAASGASAAIVFDGLAGGLIAFAAGAVLFRLGLLGGGDVKLLAAVALWAGQPLLIPLLIVTLAAGGLLALALLAVRVGRTAAVSGGGGSGNFRASLRSAMRSPAPFGVAIAAGALYVAIRLLGPAAAPGI